MAAVPWPYHGWINLFLRAKSSQDSIVHNQGSRMQLLSIMSGSLDVFVLHGRSVFLKMFLLTKKSVGLVFNFLKAISIQKPNSNIWST